MADSTENQWGRHLPARVPDLLLYFGNGAWRIGRLSPKVEKYLGGDGRDRPIDEFFPDASPRFSELADEVVAGGAVLKDIRVSLQGKRHGAVMAAEVRPRPNGAGEASLHIEFFFRELAPSEALAPRFFHGMVGAAPAVLELFRKIELYGASDASVVITGETGTGKELVARALHEVSPRSNCPYVAVNCSAISKELLESELFGHEKGSFTGALRTHRGRFERADGGTLFLDEIGDMPPATQVKLLRVLENRVIERVGSERETPVDVRVICATNVPLERAVAEGRFRSDLYHRLAILRLHLPPLRERIEDLPFLVDFFLSVLNRKYRRQVKRLTPEALQLLGSYLWPGNIRELRNVLERVLVETQGEVIGGRAFRDWTYERQHLSPGHWGSKPLAPPAAIVPPYSPGGRALLTSSLEQVAPEKEYAPAPELDADTIRSAVRQAQGNIALAARRLGIHRATLYRHLKKLGLSRVDLGS